MKTRKLKTGDIVRSFDFDCKDLTGERACYVIGIILDADVPSQKEYTYSCYRIKVTSAVWDGRNVKVQPGTIIFAPMNGTEKEDGTVTDFVELHEDMEVISE